jgi:signal transduction histidine kinase
MLLILTIGVIGVIYSQNPILSGGVIFVLTVVAFISTVLILRSIKQEETYIEAKTVFISVASHDLHSPLTGIIWAAGSLAEATENLEHRAKLLNIVESSRSMLQSVDDALAITNLDHLAQEPLIPDKVDLLELIDQVINSFKLTAAQKSVSLQRINQWPSSYAIAVDEKQFRRVIANIFSNAIKFTTPNTPITVSFSEDSHHWSLAIHNDGPLIEEADQKRIFDIHARTTQAEKLGEHGVGFGLYLAQQIILHHKGQISIDPNQTKGVTFIVTMPKSS